MSGSVLCAGIVVADHVSSPISHLPAAGELVLADKLLLTIGGCAANVAVDNTIRLQQITGDQQAQVRAGVQQSRDVQQRRQQAEARLGAEARTGDAGARQARTARLDLPRVSTSARATDPGQGQPRPGRQPPPWQRARAWVW